MDLGNHYRQRLDFIVLVLETDIWEMILESKTWISIILCLHFLKDTPFIKSFWGIDSDLMTLATDIQNFYNLTCFKLEMTL